MNCSIPIEHKIIFHGHLLLHEHCRSHGNSSSPRSDRSRRSEGSSKCSGGGWNRINRRDGRSANWACSRTCSASATHRNVPTRTQTRVHIRLEAHHTLIVVGGNRGTHGYGHGRNRLGQHRTQFRRGGNWNSGSDRGWGRLWPDVEISGSRVCPSVDVPVASHAGRKRALHNSLVINFVPLVLPPVASTRNVLFGKCETAISTVAASSNCVPPHAIRARTRDVFHQSPRRSKIKIEGE